MNPEKLTQKSMEALRDAQHTAQEYGNQQLTQVHLLGALIYADGGLCGELLQKMGADTDALRRAVREEIERLPRISGTVDADRLYLSREADTALQEAERQADGIKDEYV